MCASFRYELAEEYADDDDAKVSISELRQSVLEELEMHGSFCQVKFSCILLCIALPCSYGFFLKFLINISVQ